MRMKHGEVTGGPTQVNRFTRTALICGAIAGPLFTVAWLIEGATRASYSPLRHPISSLALGELGWTQAASFIITGILTMALAVGLWRALRARGGSAWAALLIGVVAVGLIGAGLFPTEGTARSVLILWATYSRITAVAFLAMFVLANAGLPR